MVLRGDMRSVGRDDVSAEEVVAGWRWSCRGMAKVNSGVFFRSQEAERFQVGRAERSGVLIGALGKKWGLAAPCIHQMGASPNL